MAPTPGKTALVLAGGGLTGAVYEIGALRAIDDLLVDRTVNDFDIFVGTSAGALVAAMLAAGFSPGLMLDVMNEEHPEIAPIRRGDIFPIDPAGLLQSTVRFPRKLLAAWSAYVQQGRGDTTLFDLLWQLLELLPPGLYDGAGLERYVRRVLKQANVSNRFGDLERQLYIIATDLDNGERAVFGAGYDEQATISQAVAASAAMPFLYKPVRIGQREYVDGGLRGNASLDLAIEQGAKLVVCINPVVPFDSEGGESVLRRDRADGHISDRGVQAVTSQVLAILLHSGLHYHVKQLRRRYPDVDIILVEPRADDEHMHFDNIMRYSARLTIARHGFESVTLYLAQDFAHYKEILTRHGIPVSRRLLVEEMQEIWDSDYSPRVLRRILSARQPSERPASRIYTELDETLCRLEEALARLDAKVRRAGSAAAPADGTAS